MTDLEQDELNKCPMCGKTDDLSRQRFSFWCEACLPSAYEGPGEDEYDLSMCFIPIPFADLGIDVGDLELELEEEYD